jgi:hypothetical protein
MSQFIIPIDSTKEAQIGWDPPLQTYYGRVYKLDENGEPVDVEIVDDEEKDGNILWVGTSIGEIRTVEQLEILLEDHVKIPRNIVIQLEVPQEGEKRSSSDARSLGNRLRGRSIWRQ